MPNWFSSSYMALRGIARGRAGATHHLTEAKQGSYQFVYGPYASPVLTIKPGDVVVAETLDAFGGAIQSIDDKPSQKLKFPFVNPQNDPITVEGGEGRRLVRADRDHRSARAAARGHFRPHP